MVLGLGVHRAVKFIVYRLDAGRGDVYVLLCTGHKTGRAERASLAWDVQVHTVLHSTYTLTVTDKADITTLADVGTR